MNLSVAPAALFYQFGFTAKSCVSDLSINQTINQSNNQSIAQSIDQSNDRAIDQLINQSIKINFQIDTLSDIQIQEELSQMDENASTSHASTVKHRDSGASTVSTVSQQARQTSLRIKTKSWSHKLKDKVVDYMRTELRRQALKEGAEAALTTVLNGSLLEFKLFQIQVIENLQALSI